MQNDDQELWKQELKRDLKEILGRYTPDQYPATIETQREYDQGLFHAQDRAEDRLDHVEHDELRREDQAYRQKLIDELKQDRDRFNQQERASWGQTRTADGQMATRAGQRGDRQEIANQIEALENKDHKNHRAYRDTDDYKKHMRQLTDRQSQSRDDVDALIRKVYGSLDERFNFPRRDFTRERDTDRDR